MLHQAMNTQDENQIFFLFGYDRLIAMLNAYYVNKIYTKLEDFKNCY